MAGVETMPGREWLPKDRYLNTSSFGRLLGEMELMKLGPFEFYKTVLEMEGEKLYFEV